MKWNHVFRRGMEVKRLKPMFQKVPKPIILLLFILIGIPMHVILGICRGAKKGYILALEELKDIYRLC